MQHVLLGGASKELHLSNGLERHRGRHTDQCLRFQPKRQEHERRRGRSKTGRGHSTAPGRPRKTARRAGPSLPFVFTPRPGGGLPERHGSWRRPCRVRVREQAWIRAEWPKGRRDLDPRGRLARRRPPLWGRSVYDSKKEVPWLRTEGRPAEEQHAVLAA